MLKKTYKSLKNNFPNLNFLDGKTHYVSSIKELNAILDNSVNYRYICCHELVPYDDIKDLLNDAKNHGPYVSKYNDYHNSKRYYLITSILELTIFTVQFPLLLSISFNNSTVAF